MTGNEKPILTMLVGLPGAGKSTYAKLLSIEDDMGEIFSSDKIRKEINGDESSQENNDKVFSILHSRIKKNLIDGKNAIYDATNIHSTYRKHFLDSLKGIDCVKRCEIILTSYYECCRACMERERQVPRDIVRNMYMHWNTPYYFEGWDEILLVYNYGRLKTVDDFLFNERFTNQYNKHHRMTLGEHCKNVGQMLSKYGKVLEIAGYLHDSGKPFTRTFRNHEGIKTEDAHYYQHHCTGAYDSLLYDYDKNVNPLDVSILVNLHMEPYFWGKENISYEKAAGKYQKLWGEKLFNNVMLLHDADVKCH